LTELKKLLEEFVFESERLAWRFFMDKEMFMNEYEEEMNKLVE